MQYCPVANYHYVHVTCGKVFGGTLNICFWLFPKNGSISERTLNRALNSSYNCIQFCIKKKKKKKKIIFAMCQNYPLALRNDSLQF